MIGKDPGADRAGTKNQRIQSNRLKATRKISRFLFIAISSLIYSAAA